MKTKLLPFLMMVVAVFATTSAFADNETDVSLNVEYTYSITTGNGDWTGSPSYNWSISPASGWTSSLSSASSNTVTWTAAGTYTITVQATDGKGCYSEPVTLSVTVTDETYCISNQTNTTTCSQVAAGSGNNSSGDDDYFTFDVTISHPATSGTYTVSYTVAGNSGTADITSVVAGTDKTATITVNHSSFVSEFTNSGSTDKNVSVAVTGVANNSSTAVDECSSVYTFTDITVYPKPVIAF